ncbi:class D sortase [Shewanella violacea]|uniref:LPXTG-site transpeptidase family protein n=1 Tax=Shewanella violacea (strain JCM 10179 / CIP 106290 / LMG 19151 / DSS12) TaxID=637905 RepID=D4ZKC4_SHEVD|nr:class D sortase [Shewanella violacea]BAJ02123.1 LPXTG-site transpeptidase family protein [Shewanella violacea DSS12]
MAKLHAAYGEQVAIDDVKNIIASNQAIFKPLPVKVSAKKNIVKPSVEDVAANSTHLHRTQVKLPTQPLHQGSQTISKTGASSKQEASKQESSLLRPMMSDWSQTRIESFTTAKPTSPLLGLLAIPSIKLEVAIFDGTAEVNLNKGVGRVIPSRGMNGEGNLSLAGHRDGFFRKIGQLTLGQELSITDLNGQIHRFRVVDTWIVDPKDTYVMKRTSRPSVTLITCYPFYFVGSAPQRYIVRAEQF